MKKVNMHQIRSGTHKQNMPASQRVKFMIFYASIAIGHHSENVSPCLPNHLFIHFSQAGN